MKRVGRLVHSLYYLGLLELSVRIENLVYLNIKIKLVIIITGAPYFIWKKFHLVNVKSYEFKVCLQKLTLQCNNLIPITLSFFKNFRLKIWIQNILKHANHAQCRLPKAVTPPPPPTTLVSFEKIFFKNIKSFITNLRYI